MHINTTRNTPPRKATSTAKLSFVLLSFLVPFGSALLFFSQVIAGNIKIDNVDFAFCMTTLTNCQNISPFFDIAGWRELFITNGLVFSVWLAYATAIFGLFNATGIFWKGCSFALIIIVPLSFSGLGVLITLLEGAHM